MDCLGYTIGHKETLKRFLNIPIVLARTVVARAVQELIYWEGKTPLSSMRRLELFRIAEEAVDIVHYVFG